MKNPQRQRLVNKISIIILGAVWGAIIGFFAFGSLLMQLLGGPIPGGTTGTLFLLGSFLGGAAIGATIAYLAFKKSKYSKPQSNQPYLNQ